MRVERGASQILFGLLPGQTVDLEGRIWKVAKWSDPVVVTIDQATVRSVLLQAAFPWTQNGKDDGLAQQLHARIPIEIVRLNEDRGVLVEPFPKQWRCKSCNRITQQGPGDRCKCGAVKNWAQIQFVAFHGCGASKEPYIKRCPQHNAVSVRLPGTESARELFFYCPECPKFQQYGFPFQRCECSSDDNKNAQMSINVHRAGQVFSPQFAVVVNPPDPADAARARATGGGAKALEWVLNGMQESNPAAGRQTPAELTAALKQGFPGLSDKTLNDMVERAVNSGEMAASDTPPLDLPQAVLELAQEEALNLSSAVLTGRVRVSDMVDAAGPPLRSLYEGRYHDAVAEAQLAGVDLLTNFPVATLAYGFTRGDSTPGESRLVTFKERGHTRAYASLTRTEALLFQMDPVAIHRYLIAARCRLLAPSDDARNARIDILRNVTMPTPVQEDPQQLGRELLTVLHSYAHRTIRKLSTFAGIERDSLAEYLLPHHLSFVVYAVARGDFVLGGLQACFETNLHRVLEEIAEGESRCPLDPGCRSGGGACMACLHLGEPSCRWYNRFLDRSALFGRPGLLS
ncbi:hypothetical protein [Nonomuraea sp. NPDC048916]|uniref:hypothetical protein n=1 Tax=Nonomuraea sp. NPDC048916 TaxID=3154232 RepID=UPI00340EE1CF